MKNMSRLVAAALVSGVALVSALPASAEDNAHVSILHGVPGATVDVYVNGEELLADFTPGTLTDPVALPAGNYDLKVTAPDAGADGDAVIEANGVTVPAGANITVVAHLDASGTPVLTPFVNDTSASDEGARLTVRHVAAAPEVDVRAGGSVVVPGLANPEEASLDLAAGTVSADVVAAGTDTVVLGPADVTLTDGNMVVVYAWGSLEGETLALATQSIQLGSNPSLPHTGAEGPAINAVSMAAAGLLALGVVGIALTRRSRVTA